MMFRLAELRILADAYMQATNISDTQLSRRIKPSSNRLIATLLAGREIGSFSAEMATDFFQKNWPPGVTWPLGEARGSKRMARVTRETARLRDGG